MPKAFRAQQSSVAFGVQPGYAPFSLRQARYPALAETIAEYIERREGPIDLLDVGVGYGATRMYLEQHACSERVRFHGVDIFPKGHDYVHKHQDWTLTEVNLEQGLPELESDRYDVLVCEQVIEHIHQAPLAVSELARVLKPGGLAIIGVPIFPEGLHLIRKHVVPMFDRMTGRVRGHVQAFSRRTFLQLLRQGGFEPQQSRGFRIISGGPLRPLENHRWWWQFNRRLGAAVPGLCVEVQVVATKAAASRRARPTKPAARAA